MSFDLLGTGGSIVVVALIVGLSGFAGPVLVQRMANKQRQRERFEDKADRDAVAKKAETAANKLVASNEEVRVAAKEIGDAAKEVGEKTMGTLHEIKQTGEHTLTIVNSEKSKMVVRLAKQARLIARLMPDDTEAQLIANEAEKEEASLSKLAKELPGGGQVTE